MQNRDVELCQRQVPDAGVILDVIERQTALNRTLIEGWPYVQAHPGAG